MKVIIVRLAAVVFMLLGLWRVFLFLQAMVTSDSPNLLDATVGVILFRAGDNLFSLNEIGRKLALGVLGINGLYLTIYGILALFQKPFSFTLTGLGTPLHSESLALFLALVIPWVLIEALLGALLLQPGTRLIFRRG